MTDLARERAFALELAELADGLSLPAFGRYDRADAATKADGTWVTEADLSVERRLRAAINEAFPDHAVLGEEDGLVGAPDAPTWVLDPIDGTTNFVRGNPVWATLIGLRVDGVDRLGVVSAPALGHRWDGVVGHGARRDGAPITVSTVDDLARAEVSFGGLDWFARTGRSALVGELVARTARVRGYGDFWHHCLVAGGSTEIAIEAAVSSWDLVAVRALVEAAGGRATSLGGEPTSDGGDIVTTNGRLHEAVLALVRASTAGRDTSLDV